MQPTDKIAIGFVDHGTVRGEFANDLFLLGASRPARFAGIVNVQDSLLSRGRNRAVKQFLDTDADWLLFLDADQRFTPDLFDSLTEVADDGERLVVSGLYFGVLQEESVLYPVPVPNIYSLKPGDDSGYIYRHILYYPPNAVIQIDACGAGMMLIHRRVVEDIRKMAEPQYSDSCWFLDYPAPNGEWSSEDLHFCRQIQAAGHKIFCHTGVVSPHIKHYLVNEIHYESMRALLDSGQPTA
jgi:hypothetical protein